MKTIICISIMAAFLLCFTVSTHAAVLPQGDLNGNNTFDIAAGSSGDSILNDW